MTRLLTILAGAVVAVLVAVLVSAQLVPRATADMRLAWDQEAASLADAQAYRYTAYVDGAGEGVAVAAECSGEASPFVCVTPLPVQSLGDHTVAIAAQQLLGEDLWSGEARSEVFSFRVVDPVRAPGRLRLFR